MQLEGGELAAASSGLNGIDDSDFTSIVGGSRVIPREDIEFNIGTVNGQRTDLHLLPTPAMP